MASSRVSRMVSALRAAASALRRAVFSAPARQKRSLLPPGPGPGGLGHAPLAGGHLAPAWVTVGRARGDPGPGWPRVGRGSLGRHDNVERGRSGRRVHLKSDSKAPLLLKPLTIQPKNTSVKLGSGTVLGGSYGREEKVPGVPRPRHRAHRVRPLIIRHVRTSKAWRGFTWGRCLGK